MVDRTKWFQPQVLALIAGYDEYKMYYNHPTKKKLFWEKVAEYMFQETSMTVEIKKIKAKWRKLKDAYFDAKQKINTSGENFTTFTFYNDLDKVLGDRPIGNTLSLDIGTTSVINETNEIFNDDNEIEEYEENSPDLELDNIEDGEQVHQLSHHEGSALRERREDNNERINDENIRPVRQYRLRRRRKTNIDKLLEFKEKELKIKTGMYERKMQFLKEKEEAKNRRHNERRLYMLRVYGLNETDMEEYLE